MQSLRDKLLKAGLITEDAAKRAELEKAAAPAPRPPAAPSHSQRSAPFEGQRRPAPYREEPRLPKLPPLAGTKEAHRLASKKQLETDRKIREQVYAAEVAQEPGDTTFYFVTRKSRLRRLTLSAAQAKALEDGQLAVVERPDPDKIEHALVPPEVALSLLALSERAVRFLNREGQKVGFLTDEEIHARAYEADAPDEEAAPIAAGRTEPGALSRDKDLAMAAPEGAVAPTAEAETWITIKRKS